MKHIISLGAGVQSSTMALMAAHGKITPMPECAIFADTMAEPKSVYRWLDWLETQLPFPVVRVSRGDLIKVSSTVVTSKHGNNSIKAQTPVYVGFNGDRASITVRQCTQEFKIEVIQKEIRNRFGKQDIVQWIGISLDEAHRMKSSRNSHVENRWPLIDLRMNRHDCLSWIEKKGYPQPPRSCCVMCPFMNNSQWLRLKNEEPDEFQKAVQYERDLQIAMLQVPSFKAVPYLHRSLIPIDQVEFDPYKDQINLFGNECEGMCGV